MRTIGFILAGIGGLALGCGVFGAAVAVPVLASGIVLVFGLLILAATGQRGEDGEP